MQEEKPCGNWCRYYSVEDGKPFCSYVEQNIPENDNFEYFEECPEN